MNKENKVVISIHLLSIFFGFPLQQTQSFPILFTQMVLFIVKVIFCYNIISAHHRRFHWEAYLRLNAGYHRICSQICGQKIFHFPTCSDTMEQ